MDLYITSLLLGAVGLGAMAVGGLGSHGHAGQGSHGHGAGHAGHGGHGGDAGHVGHGGHAGHDGHAGHAGHSHGQAHAHHGQEHGVAGKTLMTIMSPRFLFSLCLGFGTAGELLRPMLGGPLLFAAALAGGIVFERFIVSPLWNFSMRFASKPSSNLEGAVTDEATAVTAFDANGQGIVSFEVDGQVVQILATLQPNDRLLGSRVRVGQRVRIEDVNAEKNCCTVSVL